MVFFPRKRAAFYSFSCGLDTSFRCQHQMLLLHAQCYMPNSYHFHVPRYQGSLFLCQFFLFFFFFPFLSNIAITDGCEWDRNNRVIVYKS